MFDEYKKVMVVISGGWDWEEEGKGATLPFLLYILMNPLILLKQRYINFLTRNQIKKETEFF